MSKRAAKSQASSARAGVNNFGSYSDLAPAFGVNTSALSYLSEPPDLSAVSNPNVVVLFRNLSKRDSTTKAKALEDILAYVLSLGEPVEESLIEAWMSIYPRTSIENSRAVRQNAHAVQGAVAVSAGKRMAKYMSRSVAAWLGGLYDSDRAVVDATQNSIRQVFTTPEKIQSIRKAYQHPILEYCRAAVERESVESLSDTRVVSPEDAEAKYNRVISACVFLAGSLLSNLTAEELAKFQNEYDELLGKKKLWDLASSNDATMRRSIHRLLKTCLAKDTPAVANDMQLISKSYISVALQSDQIGSILDYTEALIILTSKHPSVWTEQYRSKTSVDRRLRQFLIKGSQLGPRDFWTQLSKLFDALPLQVLPKNAEQATELLNSLHDGITRVDEPKSNHSLAFDAYLHIVDLVNRQLPSNDKTKVLEEMALPIVLQYVSPSVVTSMWSVPKATSTNLLEKLLQVDRIPEVLNENWSRISQQLVTAIKTLSPEQSKEYVKSQEEVMKKAVDYAMLQNLMLQSDAESLLKPILEQTLSDIIREALHVITNRNGKPYGVASAVATLLSMEKSQPLLASDTAHDLNLFLSHDAPNLLKSPSSPYLIEILYSISARTSFAELWHRILRAALVEAKLPSGSIKALQALLTSQGLSKFAELALSDTELQNYLQDAFQQASQGSTDWGLLQQILQLPVELLSHETIKASLTYMTGSLTISERLPSTLQGFRFITRSNPSILNEFLATTEGSNLMQAILLISESPDDDVAQDAVAVSASMQTLLASATGSIQSVHEIIHKQLQQASAQSVSIETLLNLAKQCVNDDSTWDKIELILPRHEEWMSAIMPFVSTAPNASLAITNPLGGAVYLPIASASFSIERVSRDADMYSPAYRIAQYLVRLFTMGVVAVNKIPDDVRLSYLYTLATIMQLIDDNLSLARANDLWADYSVDLETDAIAFRSEAQSFITQELKYLITTWPKEKRLSSLMSWAIKIWSSFGSENMTATYYEVRAYAVLVSDAIEISGWKVSQTPQLQEYLKTIRKSNWGVPLIGLLHAFRDPLAGSKSCERICGEIVADLTGLDIEKRPTEVLSQLVLLNTLLIHEGIIESIARQRVIFWIKHVVPWLEVGKTSWSAQAELCRALTTLLPTIRNMYGEHWQDILIALPHSWSTLIADESSNASTIPFIHASLKLLAQFRALVHDEEPNEDLIDAWNKSTQAIASGLVNLLKYSQHFPDEFHQPQKMVNDVLARQIAKIPFENLQSTEDLFPLLYVESHPVQQTAFNILHKQIPAIQEQISIVAALEKNTARLPEELLSLILDSPATTTLADADFERSVPPPLRGYLLSWLLVFDHLEHASFKVRNDYIENVKEGEYLPPLLNFTFDILGHKHNRAVDVSKVDITTYEPDVELPKRDLQWLLTHLYFLCLKHVPALTKTWFKDCKSRAIVVSLEPWTEKYISPPVIADALEDVTKWSIEQAKSDDDSPFSVRVAPKAREITASYMVDEQMISMRVSLPPAFPLANAHIEGLNRVAVNEQKWQSWLRTSLGAITIFNGSLIDALNTFRRNVDGAIKGQTECAICYSIVGSDRKLPNKKCQTCKYLFHGSCLFKWFKTSSSSSCPLCRNPFNYG